MSLNQEHPKLRVASVAKYYGSGEARTTALAPTDLAMSDGEFLTLLGPSGAGKTTLLAMVAGLTQPSTGNIWIDGRDVTFEPSNQRDLGLVFQNYALFPHLSIYENIAFPLRMRKQSSAQIDRAVRDVLELVQLAHVAERSPREISGGQQQRIALARCIVYRPSIILMDEPLGALDKNLREHMQSEIKKLHAELGITVLYVTHDQEEALAMSDRICLMNNARIEQLGTPQELYFRPASVFAANFLGESNLLAGRLVHNAAGQPVLRLGARTELAVCDDEARHHATGSMVNGMVRPESIWLDDARVCAVEAVTLTATVHGVRFAGGVTRIDVATDDGVALVAKQLTPHLVSPLAQATPRVGERVSVGWPRAAMRLLPGDAP